MKKSLFTVLTAGALIVMTSQFAFAAETSTTAQATSATESIQMSAVLKNLRASGYRMAKEVQFGQGDYKAKVLDALGDEHTIAINPKTGDVVDTTIVPMKVNMNEAVDNVVNAGYTNVYFIEMDHGKYTVKAFDKNNKKVKLLVDGTTGAVSTK